MSNIAIFGSAFDPPTLGHADAINSIMGSSEKFDKVLLVPSYTHAFGKQMTEYAKRVEMLNSFTQDLQDSKVVSCDIEQRISQQNKPVYTFDVLSYLSEKVYPESKLTFVMGPDNSDNWHKFYKSSEIEQRWHIFVVPQRQAIRSTLVRKAVANKSDIRGYVTPNVADYIVKNNLYLPR